MIEVSAEDIALLRDAVRAAGALAMTWFQRGPREWRKADGSRVSEADLAVDSLLKERLGQARPDYGWLSEETADGPERLGRSHLWIVDPIDGTRAFVSGGDDWCVGAALAVAGKPVAGCVYKPIGEEFYEAAESLGARLNGRPIAVSRIAGLDGASIAGSASALKRLGGAIMPVDGSRQPLLLRLCRVARGAFDGAASLGLKKDWDLAAGDIILREAGGVVTDALGAPLVYNRRQAFQAGFVAAVPAIHGAIVKAMRA